MKNNKKITIMTAEEVADSRRNARKRVIFQEMLQNGTLKETRFENKKRKKERNRRKKEDRNFKKGGW
jgi:hypothetical protein